MAPDKKDKKRKAPVASNPPAKKTKKVEAKPAEAPKDDAPKPIPKKNEKGAEKSKKTSVDSAAKTNGKSARQVKPRKRAADFLSDDEETTAPAPAEKKAGNKKSKKEETVPAAAGKKAASKAKKVEEVAEESDEEDDEDFLVDSAASDDSEEEEEDIDENDEEDEAEDDQTAALIKGFESSGDEDESGDEGYSAGKPVPKIPDSKKIKQKLLKKQKKNAGTPEEPGTVYIGRIPHGFYEHEMRAYFTQFGEILRLRLSRNRITGRSKHYAFVEFNSVTVAKIVAETMDNYLMYGHILKCKFVPQESLHPEVWKGANRRFKKTPWNRIEKKRLEKGKTRDQWSEQIAKEQKKRVAKAKKLKELGYEFNLPQIKAVEDVPVQEPKAVEAAETTETPTEEPVKAVEAPAAKEDTPKKAKKSKKADQETPKETVTESPAAEKKKAKKASKTKTKA